MLDPETLDPCTSSPKTVCHIMFFGWHPLTSLWGDLYHFHSVLIRSGATPLLVPRLCPCPLSLLPYERMSSFNLSHRAHSGTTCRNESEQHQVFGSFFVVFNQQLFNCGCRKFFSSSQRAGLSTFLGRHKQRCADKMRRHVLPGSLTQCGAIYSVASAYIFFPFLLTLGVCLFVCL